MIEHQDEKYRENKRDYLVNRALAVRVDADINYLNLAGIVFGNVLCFSDKQADKE